MKSVKEMNQEEYEQFCEDMEEQEYMEYLNEHSPKQPLIAEPINPFDVNLPVSKYQFWINPNDYVIVMGTSFEQAFKKYGIMTGKDDYFDMQIIGTW